MRAIERWLPQTDGITISGGEPFDQEQALQELLSSVRSSTAADVLVYSGYGIEALSSHLAKMSGLFDALISDPYLVDAPQTLALRGSDNQRLHLLTALGQERLSSYQRLMTAGDRAFDLMIDEDSTFWLAGIPGREDFKRLSAALSQQNHQIFTTQDRSMGTVRQRPR
jgi:anaerobic ribonucleoside-triphosphate reductase activating protein